MANLDGSRSHGARWDVLAGAILRHDPARFTGIYRVLMQAARAEGIGPAR
jgi:putative restriction endonuclease